MTFKDVKARSWDQCFEAVAGVLAMAYGDHCYLLASGALGNDEAERFRAILGGEATEGGRRRYRRDDPGINVRSLADLPGHATRQAHALAEIATIAAVGALREAEA